MRMRWLIDRCLGRKHQRSKILGPISVQVKAPDGLPTSITAPLGCCGASMRFGAATLHDFREFRIGVCADHQAF